jgi:hypothetical protein
VTQKGRILFLCNFFFSSVSLSSYFLWLRQLLYAITFLDYLFSLSVHLKLLVFLFIFLSFLSLSFIYFDFQHRTTHSKHSHMYMQAGDLMLSPCLSPFEGGSFLSWPEFLATDSEVRVRSPALPE